MAAMDKDLAASRRPGRTITPYDAGDFALAIIHPDGEAREYAGGTFCKKLPRAPSKLLCRYAKGPDKPGPLVYRVFLDGGGRLRGQSAPRDCQGSQPLTFNPLRRRERRSGGKPKVFVLLAVSHPGARQGEGEMLQTSGKR